MDLDLRKLRYFVAVADTLHFGRAADELHIAQPALSRQIRALEHDLGTPLLTRDSHGVALTDAGRQLLTDAGPLLASAHAVRRRVTVAARGSQRLMVGFRAGIAVTPAVRLFADRHPDVLVDVQRIEGDDQATMLLDGRIDVGYVRLPIDEAGLRVAPLYTEPRVAVLPVGHRLADKDQASRWSGMATRARNPPGARTLTPGTWCAGWTRRSSMSRPAGASRSWPARQPCSTHIRTSATCPSRIWHPTRCASRWRQRAPRRWSTTSSPRLRRRPRSRQNAGTTKCGSLEAVPFQSTVEQLD
jgi:DNA-binding transcriptional LysR family regulator